MTAEECNKFFDTLKILVLEHPIVADWWVEIMDRYDMSMLEERSK